MARGSSGGDQDIIASIVVPCYHEAGNIVELTEAVFKAISKSKNYTKTNTEMIFVDDNSNDGTVENVRALANRGYPVRVIVRTSEKGLSSAVLEGFSQAKGSYLICMDGDLQHPPKAVPKLLDVLYVDKKEFVIGTRYGVGAGVDPSWPRYRRVISGGARLLARPLTPMSDPMTGYFGITKEALGRAGGGKINKLGFKICLELYCKCKIRSHGEVSINFGKRKWGKSNLTGNVMLYYIQQLLQLYTSSPVHIVLLLVLVIIAYLIIYAKYK